MKGDVWSKKRRGIEETETDDKGNWETQEKIWYKKKKKKMYLIFVITFLAKKALRHAFFLKTINNEGRKIKVNNRLVLHGRACLLDITHILLGCAVKRSLASLLQAP
jgi:hypothetical protein